MTAHRKLIVLTAALSFGAAEGAAAQVFIDPGSPSQKEYGIPLEDVRRDTSTESDAPTTSGERTAPLFGEGIDENSSAGAARGAESGSDPDTNSSSGRPGAQAKGGAGQALSRAESVIASTRPVGATIPQGGFGSFVTIAALALSVLLLGGVAGSIARRRS